MHTLPANAPQNLYEAFAYIGSVTKPTIDDLKLMVILEAAGKAMYDELAAGANPRVQALLIDSGNDELTHACRLSEAIGKLTGTNYSVPEATENPYLTGWVKPDLTADLLNSLAQAEFGGEALYEHWAENCENSEARQLFRQNGREETSHGHRLKEVSGLLAL
ncbi:MAG TPA: ferritin family protein [Candidatus Saccharimonadales bacterium]|nr:ferritin family protein [Candidatus Saccharimonadales bacterium]